MENSKYVKTSKPEGWVCIDDTRFNRSIGGIRLIAGVTQKETELLAKAMSYKLHTFNLPLSGAKGSVNSDSIEDFYAFIADQKIKRLISGEEDHQFITGPDIGTSEEEYYVALQKAELEELIRPGLLSNNSKEFGLPLDNIVTAYGVIVAAEELVKKDKNSDPLLDKKIAIEGFGKVGTGIAKILDGRAKIVALSTRYGCIRAEEDGLYTKNGGFDIEKIIKLQQEHGDTFIEKTGYSILPVDDLFSTNCDILIPGARTEVITKVIAERIIDARPKVVVPVSNYPYTTDGLEILKKSNIVCFPDFVASAGAIIAAMIEFAGAGGEEEAMNLVDLAIRQETRELIMATSRCGDPDKSMYQVAIDRANTNKEKMVEKGNIRADIKDIALQTVKKYGYAGVY